MELASLLCREGIANGDLAMHGEPPVKLASSNRLCRRGAAFAGEVSTYVCLVQNFYFTTFLSYELVNNPPCIQESRGKDKVYHVI